MSEKKRIPFYVPALALLALVCILYALQPKPVDWTPNWSRNSKTPFGAKALYELLPGVFKNSSIEFSRQAPFESSFDSTRSINFIAIGLRHSKPTQSDFAVFERITRAGGTVFISDVSLGSVLEDTLGFSTSVDYFNNGTTNHRFNFSARELQAPVPYTQIGLDPAGYFDTIPETAVVLARNISNRPVTIKLPRHKGQIILNTTPFLFSNYYLLRDNNIDFVEKTLSFMPDQHTIWDEFYKVGRAEPVTPLRVLLSHPGFKTAWFLMLVLIVLFILFMSKRVQRTIPVIKPYSNSTLEFTETVGRLYFNQKDHLNLAHKKINFFLEKIRLRYHIKTDRLDAEFARTLAQRSDVPEQDVKRLTGTLHSYLAANNMSDKDLMQLNQIIEDFEKRIK